jgi:hypothetical protein
MTNANQNQGGQQGDNTQKPGQQSQTPGSGGQQGDKPAEKPTQQPQK